MLVRVTEYFPPFEEDKPVKIICTAIFNDEETLYLAKKHIVDKWHGGAASSILKESIDKGFTTSPEAVQLVEEHGDDAIMHDYWWLSEGEFEILAGATNEAYVGFLKSF